MSPKLSHFRTHIFYSNFFTQPPNECPKLVRNRRTKIFSQDEFEGSHKEFQNGSSRLPSNEVYLGFALRCYFSDPKRNSLPISAIVKSRRSQHDLDMVSFSKQVVIIPTNCEAVFIRSTEVGRFMVMAQFVLLSVHPFRLCPLFAFVALTSISLISLIYSALFTILVTGLCSSLDIRIPIFLFSHFVTHKIR